MEKIAVDKCCAKFLREHPPQFDRHRGVERRAAIALARAWFGDPGRDLLLVGVLKGAVFFMADLMRHLTRDHGYATLGYLAGVADSPASVTE